MSNDTYDVCIVGGGIVGLAVALSVMDRMPGAKVVVLEKEEGLARHQTGHNSGVIHAGIYYAPGSLKARLCRAGAIATKSFCDANGINYEVCGKLLVATDDLELERMEALAVRGTENGIELDVLDAAELLAMEPNITGLGAIHVPSTGIVDYVAICRAMADRIERRGGAIRLRSHATGIRESAGSVTITLAGARIEAGHVVVCAGLQSDRLAKLAGLEPDFAIIPFRGEYFTLGPNQSEIVRHLIYPIPDPALPFLGVHVTRMADGSITVGPNAVLGFAREGYPKGSIDVADLLAMASFPGFWRLIGANWRSGIGEMADSALRTRYLERCRKFVPGLALGDLSSPRAGIRAQAVHRDGRLEHDFLFLGTDRMLHVCNAPSPAATSAIPIAEMIVDRLLSAPASPSLASVGMQ